VAGSVLYFEAPDNAGYTKVAGQVAQNLTLSADNLTVTFRYEALPEVTVVLAAVDGNYLSLVDRDQDSSTFAGVYDVVVNEKVDGADSWYLTATDVSTGTVYLVDLETAGATVTVREVSDEAAMQADASAFLTEVTDDPAALAGSAKAFCVVDDGVSLTTNGDETLGLIGSGEDGAKVALLFDDAISLAEDASAEDDMTAVAEDALGCDLGGWNRQFKYLDLVNATDGNAVVAADGSVTIYWPYPDGVTYETAGGYDFKLLHYAGLERGYFADGATTPETVEEIELVPTEHGLMFETDSFSPYGLLWREKDAGGAASAGTETPAASGETAATTEQATARSGRAALAATGDPASMGLACATLLGGAGTLAARRTLGRKKR
jgi:hypothetical protein